MRGLESTRENRATNPKVLEDVAAVFHCRAEGAALFAHFE
jgi:hypothetical protein